ncbi:hypothetical protein LINGRAHAP2_LOCUS31811 [Linum grandiflorum]
MVLAADHPYFISSGDNPSTILVSVSLTSSIDYHSWARSMRMSLLSKNKLAPSDVLYTFWERANVLVFSWLHRSISPEIA